jgi:general secretion pathway protein G
MLARLRRLRSDEGFTLIELIIVIVILGILAAVVVFAVGGVNSNGTLSACKADKSSVATAAESYFAQNSAYPATIATLVPGFLHSTPSGANYTINLGTSATVTSTLAGC